MQIDVTEQSFSSASERALLLPGVGGSEGLLKVDVWRSKRGKNRFDCSLSATDRRKFK